MTRSLLIVSVIVLWGLVQPSSAVDPDSPSGSFREKVILGALDKVTARTSQITVKVGEVVKIGTLTVRVMKAWASDPEERPESKVFLEIVEHKTGEPKQIFRGWMFSSNPSVFALEHPVYDVWVIEAAGNSQDDKAISEQAGLDEATSHQIDELIDQLMGGEQSVPLTKVKEDENSSRE
jgi:hypothetical protein